MIVTESKILVCPRCGRAPKLRETFVYRGQAGIVESCHVLKLMCRRWLGLRLCFGPQRETWIAKDWYQLGYEEQIRRWNAVVIAERRRFGVPP